MEVIVRGELNLKINKEVMDIVSDCADKKTVAVLCRTNYEASDIKERLRSLGISFNSKDINADVGSILRSAVDSEYLVDWLSNKLHSTDYNNYLKFCSIDSRYKTESGFIKLYQNTLEKYIKVIMKIRFLWQEYRIVLTPMLRNLLLKLRVNKRRIIMIQKKTIYSSTVTGKDYTSLEEAVRAEKEDETVCSLVDEFHKTMSSYKNEIEKIMLFAKEWTM